MRHVVGHDPMLDYRRCATCQQLLSNAWARMAGLYLAPRDAGELLGRLREILRELDEVTATGAAS